MNGWTEGLTPEQRQAIFNQCNSQACKDAQAAVETAKNDVLYWCGVVAQRTSIRDAWAVAAAAAWAAAGAAAIAAATATATIFGIPAAVVLFWTALALAVIAVGLTIGLLVAQAQLNDAYGKLSNARQKFTDVTKDVMQNCHQHCWGDLTIPSCP